jgi:hypothetical protein
MRDLKGRQDTSLALIQGWFAKAGAGCLLSTVLDKAFKGEL